MESEEMEEPVSTFYEVLRLPWPGGGEWVQELIYRVDAAGSVVPNQILSTEERAALQALVDYRGPEARQAGRGNSLDEATEEESRLSLALSLALLSDEKRQEYHQLTTIRALIEDAHGPVSFNGGFYTGEMEMLEDGTGLVEVSEDGPNWTTRYTFYLLALAPEISILRAYTPFGEHSFNHNFQVTEKSPDDSQAFYDFPATLARIWRGLDWL